MPDDPGHDGPRSGIGAFADVLRRPGVGAIAAIGIGARIPATAVGVVLTLHTVITLGYGYGAAGLIASAMSVGTAVGAPLLGSVIDRIGLRPVLVLTTACGLVFWSFAPLLGYDGLLPAAFVAGVLSLPIFSLVRQVIAAIVPSGHRRPAFAMDSISIEVAYLLGPGAGSLLIVWLGSPTTMRALGAGIALAGVALWLQNPPVRADGGVLDRRRRAPVRTWLTRPLVGALLSVTAALIALMGTEFAFIAALNEAGRAWAIAPAMAVWCVASMSGGIVYGSTRRPVPLPVLLVVLGLATLPAALAWTWWSLMFLIVPAGLLTAPTLAAASDTIGELAPDRVRGLVTGLQGSATTIGIAIATPMSGALVDAISPGVAIIVAGSVAIVVAGATAWLMRTSTPERVAPVTS